MPARIVYLDIERQSGVADGIWELRQRNWLNPGQIIERPRTICFAWRWEGESETQFAAEWDRGGQKAMIAKAHQVLDEADFVVGWNSRNFDVKHLRTEMILHEMTPPSPHKDIDLMIQAKRAFGFLSNRMSYIAEQLGQKGKMETGGSELWKALRTAKGQELAQARQTMAEYNCRDVELTQELYMLMRPWLTGVNLPLYDDESGDLGPHCPACSSPRIQYRGVSRNTSYSYRRFQCQECGKWGRSTQSIAKTMQVPL